MTDCAHKKIKTATISREFLGRIFKAESKVCEDCGAEMWSNEIEVEFRKWVDGLKERPKIQFKVSKETVSCLDRLCEDYPSANHSIMLRSMIMVYLTLLSRGSEVSEFLNRSFETEVFNKLMMSEKSMSVATLVKPSFYHDIQSWGKLLEVSPNEMAAEAFHVILAACYTSDKELQEFWRKEILPNFEAYLKIA